MQVWIILLSGLCYLGLIFAIAKIFDKQPKHKKTSQPMRYAFSQAVMCSSWTFLGAIGLAATGQMEFFAVYFGPILLYTVGRPILWRIIELRKQHRITSLSDFLAARYGKSIIVGCVVTLIAFISSLPFIVMQLKAIASFIALIDMTHQRHDYIQSFASIDIPFILIITFALFLIIYGTRNYDAAEGRQGLMSVFAFDGVLKFLIAGILAFYIVYVMFNGFFDFFLQALNSSKIITINADFNWFRFFLIGLMSLLTTILLPRQFHVAVIENQSKSEFDRASLVFPIYLILLNIFIFIITLAGLTILPKTTDPNYYFLALPAYSNILWLEILVFVAVLSAVSATVIATLIALTLMITNSVIFPLLLRHEYFIHTFNNVNIPNFMNNIRRVSIVFIFVSTYITYRMLGDYTTLITSGLLSFIAMSQLGPAVLLGLFWRRTNGKAVIAGITAGFIIWTIALFIPIITGHDLWQTLGLNRFDLSEDPYTNSGAWSLILNSLVCIFGSLIFKSNDLEKQQAESFIFNGQPLTTFSDNSNSKMLVSDLCKTVELYLGADKCNQAFELYNDGREKPIKMDALVDQQMLNYAEQVLTSNLGAASARLILALLIKRGSAVQNTETYELLDDASKALKQNQDILRRALDQMDQAITVFDIKNRLINWNKKFATLLNLPDQKIKIGLSLEEICKHISKHNKIFGNLLSEEILANLNKVGKSWVLEFEDKGVAIEILTNTMPDGGLVISWNDISDKMRASKSLHTANESLERRVEERTEELTKTNEKLAIATKKAQEANLSKTRFLAAAGHDILQPLNAARLYASTLLERATKTGDAKLEQNILDSLSSVEDILDAVISISKLDSGSMQPTLNYFSIEKLFNQMQVEFAPIAESKNVDLRIIPSTLWVRSDQNLLRRILQNLISNGIKYAPNGKVVVGCRRRNKVVVFEILDNGIGMSEEEQKKVFVEFTRLDSGLKIAPGLGLGLSIVQRVAQVLNHPLKLISTQGKGSKFTLTVPIAASLSRRMDGQASRRPKRRVDIAGMKILCIDNEQKILDGMEALLKEWECDVKVAISESAALKIAKKDKEPIDFIIADYHLDDNKTGTDAVVALRKYYQSPIPAVLATADRSEEVQENAARTELSILRKPIKPAALRALLASRRKPRTPQDIEL